MAFVTVSGICLCCKRVFSFHPNKVPSLKGEPICKECVDKANIIRLQNGLEAIYYSTDAYGCANADEIDWG